jgi:hypothetical protein
MSSLGASLCRYLAAEALCELDSKAAGSKFEWKGEALKSDGNHAVAFTRDREAHILLQAGGKEDATDARAAVHLLADPSSGGIGEINQFLPAKIPVEKLNPFFLSEHKARLDGECLVFGKPGERKALMLTAGRRDDGSHPAVLVEQTQPEKVAGGNWREFPGPNGDADFLPVWYESNDHLARKRRIFTADCVKRLAETEWRVPADCSKVEVFVSGNPVQEASPADQANAGKRAIAVVFTPATSGDVIIALYDARRRDASGQSLVTSASWNRMRELLAAIPDRVLAPAKASERGPAWFAQELIRQDFLKPNQAGDVWKADPAGFLTREDTSASPAATPPPASPK